MLYKIPFIWYSRYWKTLRIRNLLVIIRAQCRSGRNKSKRNEEVLDSDVTVLDWDGPLVRILLWNYYSIDLRRKEQAIELYGDSSTFPVCKLSVFRRTCRSLLNSVLIAFLKNNCSKVFLNNMQGMLFSICQPFLYTQFAASFLAC